MVTADYSTLEIRIACAIMGDYNMYKALKSGADIHKYTASLIFHKNIEDITGRERSNSKVANFGFLYGMSATTFVGYAFDLYGLKFTKDEANELRKKWMKAYPAVEAYHNNIGKGLRAGSLILETALGYRFKPKSYTDAINMPTQGTGAECGRLAIHLMVKKDKRTLKMLRNFLHDAFYLIVPEDEKEYWAKLLSDSMIEAWHEISKSKLFKYKDIPMNADVAMGYTLGDLVDGFTKGQSQLGKYH
jgi:DNA polymerase-1